jgi:hypothetical protein
MLKTCIALMLYLSANRPKIRQGLAVSFMEEYSAHTLRSRSALALWAGVNKSHSKFVVSISFRYFCKYF